MREKDGKKSVKTCLITKVGKIFTDFCILKKSWWLIFTRNTKVIVVIYQTIIPFKGCKVCLTVFLLLRQKSSMHGYTNKK